jgi:O-succinylbenzoate synthase
MKVALYEVDATLTRSVAASAQSHEGRTRLYLELEHDGVTGYGEIAPQPTALNGDPGLEEILLAVDVVLTRLHGVVQREGELPLWARVARLASTTPAAHFAVALCEMAVLDRELRASATAISELWPAVYDTPVQATVSLLDDTTEWVIPSDATRVRVKSAPGALSPVARRRLATLRVPVLIDYNCSVTRDEEVLEQVARIAALADVAAVEQPYDAGNLFDHARLAARLDVPLSLDEGVRGLRDVVNIVNYDAAKLVCVKPARVGGVANAHTIVERARTLGLAAYLGGFFESPYARHVHRALARTCVSEPSDIATVAVRGDRDEVRETAFGFGLEPSVSTLTRARRRPVFANKQS